MTPTACRAKGLQAKCFLQVCLIRTEVSMTTVCLVVLQEGAGTGDVGRTAVMALAEAGAAEAIERSAASCSVACGSGLQATWQKHVNLHVLLLDIRSGTC